MNKNTLLLLSLFAFFNACSSGPVLYPNSKLKKVGKDKSKADIELCKNEAEDYLETGKGKKIAKSAGAGAIVGGAMGAVAGIFTGDLVKGAFQGGAIGGAGGAAVGAISPDEIKREYVNRCLSEKGYEVMGWD